MKNTSGLRCIEDNRLVVRYWDEDKKKIYSQGKRLPKEVYDRYSWVSEMKKLYVAGGTVKAVKYIWQVTGASLQECMDYLREIRGIDYRQGR